MSSLTPLSSFYLSYVFIYLRPSQVEEALLLLSKYRAECKIICGGQSFLILMRQGLVVSEYLMDIKFLKELNYIDYDPQRGLRIGAGTSQRAIERLEVIRERFRVLGEMESKLASIQTCNWGLLVAIFVMVVLLQTLLPFSLPWRPP